MDYKKKYLKYKKKYLMAKKLYGGSVETVEAVENSEIIKCDTLIWTDPGADIDDEIALWWAWTNQHINQNTIICIQNDRGGATKLKEIIGDFQKETKCTIYDRGQIPEGVVLKPSAIILIAPGIDDYLEKFDLSELNKVTYQANLYSNELSAPSPDPRPAFNDKNSKKFLEKIIKNRAENPDKKPEIRCVTTLECNKTENLFSEDLFKAIGLDESLRKTVQKTVFKNLIGRMHPKNAASQFAEGLINPDMKGSNYELAKQIFTEMGGDERGESKELIDAVNDYMETLVKQREEALFASEVELAKAKEIFSEKGLCDKDKAAIVVQKAEEKVKNMKGWLVKKKDDTTKHLVQLSKWITAIIGEEPVTENRLITSENISADGKLEEVDLSSTYESQFKKFCEIGIYSPAFDLVATMIHFGAEIKD